MMTPIQAPKTGGNDRSVTTLLMQTSILSLPSKCAFRMYRMYRMCIHKFELTFSDFCEYSYISEINFPKKKHQNIG